MKLNILRIFVFVLFGAMSCAANAQEDDAEVLTPLDQAYIETMAERMDPADYYGLFRNSEIYFFGFMSGDAVDANGLIEMSFRASMYDGKHVINIFDTEQRALNFGKSRDISETELLSVTGGGALTFKKEPFYLFLNPETQYQKMFQPDEIDYLVGVSSAIEIGEVKTQKLMDLEPGHSASENLIAAIVAGATQTPAVKRIYLCEHPFEPKSENGMDNHFLVIEKSDDGDRDIIQRVIYAELQQYIPDGQYVDFVFVDKKSRKKMIGKNHEPIYVRK